LPPCGSTGIGQFLAVSVQKERQIYEHLRDMLPDAPTRLFVHMMMDLEWAYFQNQPTYAYPRQIRRMRKLASLYPGQLIGFVAFDPYRGSDNTRAAEAAFQDVRGALDAGFAGVKLYPPTGYRATGNIDHAIEHDVIGGIDSELDGATIDARLARIIDHCCDPQQDIPILSHCTPVGFERLKDVSLAWYGNIPYVGNADNHGSGLLSDPRGWLDVLESSPARGNLRLCLGHAGDHESWLLRGGSAFALTKPSGIRGLREFAHQVYLLCRRFPNVYCDLSHMTEVLSPEDNHRARRSLVALLKVLSQNDQPTDEYRYPFFTKIMFGTDYFMPNEEGTYGCLFHVMDTIFSDTGIPSSYRRAFFFENARRYLNLPGYIRRCGNKLIRAEVEQLQRVVDA
jgi:predicted TIM-barrel fold metal-dependent hydrolase